MAVYTEVSNGDLDAFIALYDIGQPVSCKGIAEGVENSNFLLATDRGSYILTIYEKRVAKADLPYFLGLMDHLAAKGIACPTPIHQKNGAVLGELCGKPAAIISFLDGLWPRKPTARHCQLLGEALARFHMAGLDYQGHRANNLSLAGWRRLAEACHHRAHEVQAGLADQIAAELSWLEAHWPKDLAAGVIHADLFPDNVFYLGDRLSGIIDFYFACNDYLAYDVAICLNAWCFEPEGDFNTTKARLLLGSYNRTRTMPAAEMMALPVLARGSALRFLLTRLYDWLNHPPGAFVKPKDPLEYAKKLRFHQQVKSVREFGLD
jgi:homoserine kinase type II